MTTTSAPKAPRVSTWDRAVVVSLGGAGCALSYDALQQMAVAVHIRGLLTYLFPLVIDGFIAYGIRALLVLRNAPLRARLYVWALFGTATAASIWANALHAVRLNADELAGNGLRLGDTAVAALSTIAPLALAGAVHLYILIARGAVKKNDDVSHGQAAQRDQTGRSNGTEVTRTDRAGRQPGTGQVAAGRSPTALTDRQPTPLDKPTSTASSLPGDTAPVGSGRSVTGDIGRPHAVTDRPAQSDKVQSDTDRPNRTASVTAGEQYGPGPAPSSPANGQEARTPGERRSDADTEELLQIARSAVKAEDKLTRKVVAQAIRGQQIPLSSDTLTALMALLREQHGQPVTSART